MLGQVKCFHSTGEKTVYRASFTKLELEVEILRILKRFTLKNFKVDLIYFRHGPGSVFVGLLREFAIRIGLCFQPFNLGTKTIKPKLKVPDVIFRWCTATIFIGN